MRYEVQENCLTIFLPNELDHHNAEEIRRKADRLIEKHHIKCVIFDFAETNFMDSSGIGLILGRYKRVNKMSGKIYISGCRRHLEKVLEMADIFSLIPKYDNYQDVFQCDLEVTNG